MSTHVSLCGSLALLASAASVLAALDAPSNVTALTAGPATIVLSWDDNESAEQSYIVQRNDGGWATIATLPAGSTHYYDRGLALGTSYNYRVYASNDADISLAVESAATTLDYKPNIIFFLADDMGYKDLVGLRDQAIDGPTIYETPALDSFIETSALSISNAYCSGPRCVVARRSIQTGKYDWRPEAVPNNDYYVDDSGNPIGSGLWAGGTTVAGSESGAGVAIPFDNKTYGEALQDAGYRTCFIGKYHLGESPSDTPLTGYSFGDQPARGPDAQGYDVSIAAGNAGAPPASYFSVENMHATGTYTFELPDMDDANYGTVAPVMGEYITDRMTDKAIGFIADAITNYTGEPFALTLAHYAVHTPVEAKLSDINYFKGKKASMAADFAAHPAGASGLITDYSSKTRVWQDNVVYAAMMRSYDDSFAELRTYLGETNDPRNLGKTLAETTIIVVSSDHGGKSTTPLDDNKILEDDATDQVNAAPSYDPAKGAYKSGTPNAYNSYPTSNYPYRYGKTWVYEGGLKVPLLVYIPGITVGGSRSDAFVHHADLFATFVDMAGGSQTAESSDSISFMLTAVKPTASARDEMHHFFTNASSGTGNPALGAYRKGDYKLLYFIVQRRVELYNLAADPYERNDLAVSRPDMAAEMLHEVYQQALSTGINMPKPGPYTWANEQAVLVDNGLIVTLPAVPDADPSGLTLTELSPTAIELNWTVNASNATHSVVYRFSPTESNFREHAYVPVGTTTFRDQNLTPGGLYRYRVESENLGGWSAGNTGNKTLTLSTTGNPLAINAVDDTVTTVPCEVRRFNPLLNDEGEGAIAITGITQPSVGSAVIDGNWISYQAGDGFAGSTTMTYTIEDAAQQTDTASVTFTLPIASASTLREGWEFSEAINTDLNDLINTGTFGSLWRFNSVDKTNGSGQFVLAGDSGSHTRKLPARNTANALVDDDMYVTPLTSGKYRLEVKFTSWDVNAASAGDVWRFKLNNTSASQIVAVAAEITASSMDIRFAAAGATEKVQTFNLVEAGTNTLAVEFDFDADEVDFILNDTVLQSNPFTGDNLGQLIYAKNGAWSTAATSLSIDHIKLIELLAGGTLYDAYASAYPWMGILERGELEDPDGDGLNNFYEFAFGLDPMVSSKASPVSIDLSGADSALKFTPARDTSIINYAIQLATDLSDWAMIPEVPVNTPAGQLVRENLPLGGKGFGRVVVSPY
jgi:arylsulfatase A-like enzyme